jgi:hypothetical protein
MNVRQHLLRFAPFVLLTSLVIDGVLAAGGPNAADFSNEVRAVVVADLVKTAQKMLGPSATIVVAPDVKQLDRISKQLAGVKPLGLCIVIVQVQTNRMASAEANFQWAELGGHMYSYKLKRDSRGWQIVSRSLVGFS